MSSQNTTVLVGASREIVKSDKHDPVEKCVMKASFKSFLCQVYIDVIS